MVFVDFFILEQPVHSLISQNGQKVQIIYWKNGQIMLNRKIDSYLFVDVVYRVDLSGLK